MKEMVEHLKQDVGQTVESGIGFPIDVAKAGVEMLAGENPLPKAKESLKRTLWDTVALGPRLIRDMAIGILKGTLKFTWGLAKLLPLPLPLLGAWSGERETTRRDTQRHLVSLKHDITPHAQEKVEVPHSLAA